jgi:hypothetical protein
LQESELPKDVVALTEKEEEEVMQKDAREENPDFPDGCTAISTRYKRFAFAFTF